MGIVPKETIEVTAQSIGITNLSPEAALMLAPDVEYRVREIMQVGYLFFLVMSLLFLICVKESGPHIFEFLCRRLSNACVTQRERL